MNVFSTGATVTDAQQQAATRPKRDEQPAPPSHLWTKGVQHLPLDGLRRLTGALLSVVTVLGCAALFVSHVGYRHMLDDQLQYLLLPFRAIYPRFVPGDWFTWHTTHYHQSFSFLIRALHAVTGEAWFDRGLFLSHCSSVAFIALGTLRLGQGLGAGRFGAPWVFLVMTWVSHSGPAGTVLSHAQLVPADLSLGALLLALAAFIRAQPWPCGLWLGLSALLHANFAVLGAALIACALFIHHGPVQGLRAGLPIAAGYALPAAPSLWLIAHDFLFADPAAGDVDAILRIRSPHHYDLAAMGPTEWYYPLCLLLCAAPYLLRPTRDRTAGQPQQRARALTLAVLGLIGVGTLGTALHHGLLTRLFTFRLAVPLMVLSLAMMASDMRALCTRPRVRGLLWLLTAIIALAPFARSDVSLAIEFGLSPAWFALPLVFALSLSFIGQHEPRAAGSRWARLRLACCLTGLLLACTTGVQALNAPPRRHVYIGALRKPRFAGPRFGPLIMSTDDRRAGPTHLMRLIRERTPNDARLLIPPGLLTTRLHGRRAVFVDAKATPMAGNEGIEWKRRMLAAMASARFPETGYALRGASDRLYYRRSLFDLEKLARQAELTHVISRRYGRTFTMRRVFSAQGYHVYALSAHASTR